MKNRNISKHGTRQEEHEIKESNEREIGVALVLTTVLVFRGGINGSMLITDLSKPLVGASLCRTGSRRKAAEETRKK
jgi:hypothetical protein